MTEVYGAQSVMKENFFAAERCIAKTKSKKKIKQINAKEEVSLLAWLQYEQVHMMK